MVDLTGIDLTAFVHRWEESSATSYGAEWVCIDCEIDCHGMPPDRTAICKGRLLAEVVALRAQVEALKGSPANDTGDCRTCRYSDGHHCTQPISDHAYRSTLSWLRCGHLEPDYETRKPNAPRCPGWTER